MQAAVCPSGMASLAYRWELGLAQTAAVGLPAEPPLLEQLAGRMQNEVSLLFWLLERALRQGYLSGRELLVLEGTSRALFPRHRIEALAQLVVTASGELAKVPGRRLRAPEQKLPPGQPMPALADEAQPRASCAARPEAHFEEWSRLRAADRKSVGRLTRSGELWAGLPAGRERWADKLAQLEHFERPPVFTIAPACFSILPDDRAAVRVDENRGTRSALAGHVAARMRIGIHYADFRILRADIDARSVSPRVGVSQPEHDAPGMWSATTTEHGWGWCPRGCVWHDGDIWGQPLGEGYKWLEGDVLGLRLDMDTGILAGRKNGGPFKVLASGLLQHSFGVDIDGNTLPRELCWCVDLTHAGSVVRIERGEKLPNEAVPDERNEPTVDDRIQVGGGVADKS